MATDHPQAPETAVAPAAVEGAPEAAAPQPTTTRMDATPAETAAGRARGAARARRKARYWGAHGSGGGGGDDGPIDFWLMSYADMVTLLMTVFIILVLMAGSTSSGTSNDNGAFSGARGFLENLFQLRAMSAYSDENDYVVVARAGQGDGLTPEQRGALAVVKNQDLEHIQWRENTVEEISERLEQSRLDQYVTAVAEGEGVRISIPNPIIFASDVADMDPRGMAVLQALVPILASGEFSVVIEGHTDNSLPDPKRYPSNWELSAGRAASVARFMIGAGINPKRIEIAGYADTRPLMTNTTADGRAANRRVSIFLRDPAPVAPVGQVPVR